MNASKDETGLKNYATHAALQTQAAAFLTQITQTVILYVTITGGAWAVVSSNTIGVGSNTLLGILALHIVLSIGIAFGLWGMGNNFIQRLNLCRRLGDRYWPTIELMGQDAWKGPKELPKRGLLRALQSLDEWLRYTAPTWPSLRHQRLWVWVPILGLGGSIWLSMQVLEDRNKRAGLCREASRALAFRSSAPLNREELERARYIFDKAGCEITDIPLT
jgi:hypothetical protein